MSEHDLPRLSAPARNRPKPGIVHLGLGAFFRAHGAVYISEAMEVSGGDWGIIGASLMRPSQRDLLKPQGFAYTAVEQGPEGETTQIIDVIEDVLVARENPQALLRAMADPAIKIVTLTVSEKGYCHEPSTGALNTSHPDIRHDIANPDAPLTALGYLVRALEKRKAASTKPFTVLCCDNLPNNGAVVRGVVLDLARIIDPDLAEWIAAYGAFPATMVDRIVPATRDEDVRRLAAKTGVLDLSPVMHEPFRQWVVEDNFVDGQRPDLAAAGVQLVEDVEPFENMKLRCLNGTHSALAYLGYLAGHKTICDTVNDPVFASFVKHLWSNEIIPGLLPPKGQDLSAYADALFTRYTNPSIRHLTSQIAMDGSQKLPQRILATISENLDAGRRIDGLVLVVAAWMRYVGGTDENGAQIDVRDPMADSLKKLNDIAQDDKEKIDAFLALDAVFPRKLANNASFRAAVLKAYTALVEQGSRASTAALLG